MVTKSIQDQAFEQHQRVMNEREEILRNAEDQGWRPRRPEPKMIWVQPAPGYKRVMTSDLQEITGPVEVSANDLWIRARIRDNELEVIQSQAPQPAEQPPPPPPPPAEPPAPADQPVPAPPTAEPA